MSERPIESGSDFLALQRPARGADSQLGRRLERLEGARVLVGEGGVGPDEEQELVHDHWDVGLEVVKRETELDEALLLHEDWRGQGRGRT